MASQTVAAAGSSDLPTLQTIVQQNEGIYGPLIALGSSGADSLLTFNVGQTPAKRAELFVIAALPAPNRPGQTLICTGVVFVSSIQKLVAAYR